MELIRRFEGIDMAAGTTIIRENEIGQGLFVILLGRGRGASQQRKQPVARLRAGELFGEMALLGDSPTNAEVRTRRRRPASCSSARDYFRRLVSALPALRKYFEDLSRSRAQGARSEARRAKARLCRPELIAGGAEPCQGSELVRFAAW